MTTKRLVARLRKIEAMQPEDPHSITLEQLGRFFWRDNRANYGKFAQKYPFLRILQPRFELEDRLRKADIRAGPH